MPCWVCTENVNINADTCWPVEAGNAQAINSETHSRCMQQIMNRIHPPWNGHGVAPAGQVVRGPGGNSIIGYVRGPTPQG